MTNNCEYGEECRYKHIILKPGEYTCYKCGDRFGRKSRLLDHIKHDHDDPCIKYLMGKCTYGIKCVYKHINQNDQIINEISPPPQIDSQADFPVLPTPINRKVGAQNKTELMMNNMIQMLSQMTQIMSQLLKQN